MLPQLLVLQKRDKFSFDTEYRWSDEEKAHKLTEVGLASDTGTAVKLKAKEGDNLDGGKVDTGSLLSEMKVVDTALVFVHHPQGTATYSEGPRHVHAALT